MTIPGPPHFSERKGLRYFITPILAALTILVLTSPVQARMARVCSVHQSPAAEEVCGKRNMWQADHVIRFLKTHTTAGTRSQRELLWRDHLWLRKYARWHIANAQSRMLPPIPHYSGWMCIHSHEGSWTDSGDPYWGGLQMDRGFMGTYGSDFIRRFHGFANVWPVWAQMAAAERAFSSGRGYGPWPNTARYCGLM